MARSRLKPNVKWAFNGKPEANFSPAFKKHIVLHTTDGDLNDVITLDDKLTIYGCENGWMSETDYKTACRGGYNFKVVPAPHQAWEREKEQKKRGY